MSFSGWRQVFEGACRITFSFASWWCSEWFCLGMMYCLAMCPMAWNQMIMNSKVQNCEPTQTFLFISWLSWWCVIVIKSWPAQCCTCMPTHPTSMPETVSLMFNYSSWHRWVLRKVVKIHFMVFWMVNEPKGQLCKIDILAIKFGKHLFSDIRLCSKCKYVCQQISRMSWYLGCMGLCAVRLEMLVRVLPPRHVYSQDGLSGLSRMTHCLSCADK